MSLEKFLADNRSSILKKWRDLVINAYPIETQRFLKKEKDRFSNPVGQSVFENLEILFDELSGDGDAKRIARCLDEIVRVRAVQDFKPSQSVNFVFQLKKLVREEAGKKGKAQELMNDMETLEERIETAGLMAVDIYFECRQKLYEIRVNETRNQVSGLLRRANLTVEIPQESEVGGQKSEAENRT